MLRVLRTSPSHPKSESKPLQLGELLLVVGVAGKDVWCEVIGQAKFMLTSAGDGHWLLELWVPKEALLLLSSPETGKKTWGEAEQQGSKK